MSVAHHIALALVALFLLWTNDRDAEPAADFTSGTPAVFDPWAAHEDIFEVDIVQRTCALEVVLLVGALEDRRAFAVLGDTREQLDVAPNGVLLACTAAPQTSDSSQVGPGRH